MTAAQIDERPHDYSSGIAGDILLVDPSLFTGPYDSRLSEGLEANGLRPIWATRGLRPNEEDALGPTRSLPLFYPLSDGARRRTAGIWRIVKGLEHVRGLRKLLALVRGRFGVVHFQWILLPAIDSRFIRRIRRYCPVVLTVHDTTPFNGKSVNKMQRAGFDAALKAADRLIVHTAGGKALLVSRGIDADRIAIVPHGLLSEKPGAAPNISSGRWRIVQFGKIQAYKGVDVLIEALGRIDPVERTGLCVIVAGEPLIDMAPLLARARELGLPSDTLEFRPHYHSTAEMGALLAEADAFVFPYRAIEASGVLFSVASAGKWIVASDLGAFSELIGGTGDAGELVRPADADALAGALLRSIGRRPARSAATAIPDWTSIGCMTARVYREAADAWKRGHAAGCDGPTSRKLLILHDSLLFGGHERMLLALLPGIVGADAPFTDITFCVPQGNTRLRASLAEFSPRIRPIDWPFVKRRGEPYLHRFRWRYRAAVRRVVETERPSVILLVQGRIENLAVAMAALPRDTRVVSYVPMAHRLREMGRGGLIGDRVRRGLYGRPDAFIVPSEAIAAQVEASGGRGPIAVAHNVVSPPPLTGRTEARAQLGLGDADRIALFLGRMDVAQKGLDDLLGAISRSGAERLKRWTFLFVGDGPGLALIEREAARAHADIRIIPWTDRPDLFLSSADVLLLPSRWEGVPLVMLEAMHYGLPIIASAIDVYRLYLPAAHLIDFARAELGDALDRTADPEAAERFARHSATRLAPLTLEAARRTFARTLIEQARG